MVLVELASVGLSLPYFKLAVDLAACAQNVIIISMAPAVHSKY